MSISPDSSALRSTGVVPSCTRFLTGMPLAASTWAIMSPMRLPSVSIFDDTTTSAAGRGGAEPGARRHSATQAPAGEAQTRAARA